VTVLKEWDPPRLAAYLLAVGLLVAALYLPRASAPAHASGPLSVGITVDTSLDNRPISPLIYGVAHADSEVLTDLRPGLNRWGGNPNSRYNWEINAWNHARDWQFSNYGDAKPESRTPGIIADQFIEANRKAGAATLLTIPTIGWVAKDTLDSSRSVDVPKEGGLPAAPGSDAVSGYNPAANRALTSVLSLSKKPAPFSDPPDLTDGMVYQDEWVHHLVKRHGKAADGGVRFYAMDNEPDLWDSTHTDIHPVRPGYDEMLSKFLDYSAAVKAVDPTAQVTGPVSWGWTGYLHSPRDRDRWNERPDRKAHGDLEFIPWFLQQVRKHDQRSGKRSLDVLDIHFYPQAAGVYSTQTDPATDALRVRSTRALWDPAYKDESWIAEPVRLLPRMRAWIDEHYPGTKLGLTEWNWGADTTPAGAVAIAECLGVFGREGLSLANYWTSPPVGSSGYHAFKLYRNADGQGIGFGDLSVRSTSSATTEVSCFASVDRKTGQPALILINKTPDRDAQITLHIKHSRPLTSASLWRTGPGDPTIRRLQDVGMSGDLLTLTAPKYSLTLIRVK
jgi:hypothetical protein